MVRAAEVPVEAREVEALLTATAMETEVATEAVATAVATVTVETEPRTRNKLRMAAPRKEEIWTRLV